MNEIAADIKNKRREPQKLQDKLYKEETLGSYIQLQQQKIVSPSLFKTQLARTKMTLTLFYYWGYNRRYSRKNKETSQFHLDIAESKS